MTSSSLSCLLHSRRYYIYIEDVISLFKKIDNILNFTYVWCFSSLEFFLLNGDDNVNIGKYDLSLKEKSKLFTPIYTIPLGRNFYIVSTYTRTGIYKCLYENIQMHPDIQVSACSENENRNL